MDSSTIKVRRGNVILSVSKEEVDNYLAKGFDILGQNGQVVKESIPNDVPTLQAKLKSALEEIEKLKKELEAVTSKKPTKKAETNKPTSKSEAIAPSTTASKSTSAKKSKKAE